MIEFTQGNLLEADVEALVNTVNELGVMGKGIARQFREQFPASSAQYMEAAKRGEIRVGRVYATHNESLVGPRWIIHFPTKRQWRDPSQRGWILDGLRDLVRVVKENEIRSIAVPPLGCGNGGLDWDDVKGDIVEALGSLPGVRTLVYEPTSVYQPMPKQRGVLELTPSRALIVELVRRYSVLGLGCSNLEIQKLAWFLQRSIKGTGLASPLHLRFVADKYGPYADNLRHLLDALDGSYLHCKRRLSEASPSEQIWVDASRQSVVAEYLSGEDVHPFLPALEETTRIIDGFESPLGMELLATVDWLIHDGCAATVENLRQCLAEWPGGSGAARRKLNLYDDRMLGLALERLQTARVRVAEAPG